MTDDTGQAMLSIPSTDDVSLYMQIGKTMSMVYNAQMSIGGGNAKLDLPNRSIKGTLSDENGRPLAAVAFDG